MGHCLLSKGDVGGHLSQLGLYQLEGSEWDSELFTLQDVLSCLVEAELCCSKDSPGNTKTCTVETGEGSLEALHCGEGVCSRNSNVVHGDISSDGGSE